MLKGQCLNILNIIHGFQATACESMMEHVAESVTVAVLCCGVACSGLQSPRWVESVGATRVATFLWKRRGKAVQDRVHWDGPLLGWNVWFRLSAQSGKVKVEISWRYVEDKGLKHRMRKAKMLSSHFLQLHLDLHMHTYISENGAGLHDIDIALWCMRCDVYHSSMCHCPPASLYGICMRFTWAEVYGVFLLLCDMNSEHFFLHATSHHLDTYSRQHLHSHWKHSQQWFAAWFGLVFMWLMAQLVPDTIAGS